MTLISQTLDAFHDVFRTDQKPRLFQAPGRVNLIGGHIDYNDGIVVPMAIERYVVVAGCGNSTDRITWFSEATEEEVEFDGEFDRVHGASGSAA